MSKLKKYFYLFIHLNFVIGFLYAFYHFATTPRSIFLSRRLWAYECWIILSFYSLFIYLILTEKELLAKEKLIVRLKSFRRILLVNLLLLVFPWGLFLILAPRDLLEMLRLYPMYWRILGIFSLVGALIYYFPYRFYKNRLVFFILVFGFLDNLLAGIIVSGLFLLKRIPLLAFSTMPLLFYFSFFFLKQARDYKSD
ncbi:MAG: hypothetical protein M1450_05440 [Patescibacteria group bacterium]|nr:hypothetical protein [Patescibacteria group bacterium]